MTASKWELLDSVVVDSGQMIVSDPIYAGTEHALAFQPGRGDGEYPVYAIRDSNSRIIEVRVRLTSVDECPACPPDAPTPYVTMHEGEPCLMIGGEAVPKWKLDFWFDEITRG